MIQLKQIEIKGKVTNFEALQQISQLTQSNNITNNGSVTIKDCKNTIKTTGKKDIDSKLRSLKKRLSEITGVNPVFIYFVYEEID